MAVTHKFVSAIADGADATVVRPSNWNDTHVVAIGITDLTATGAPSNTTFLRGDNTWATPSGSGTAYYTWAVQTSNTALVSGNGYIANSGSQLVYTLPALASVGDHYKIGGYGSGGWQVAQNASQLIHFGNVDTTTGTGGSISSQNRYDSIELICVAANTDFLVVAGQGNMTVV